MEAPLEQVDEASTSGDHQLDQVVAGEGGGTAGDEGHHRKTAFGKLDLVARAAAGGIREPEQAEGVRAREPQQRASGSTGGGADRDDGV